MKVEIETYKNTGKFNTDFSIDIPDDIGVFDSDIIQEILEEKYPSLKNQTYTFEISFENFFNKRLVVNS